MMKYFLFQTTFLVAVLSRTSLVESLVRHYEFNVVMKNVTKLCATKSIPTVNGKFPGPTLYVREDDTVIVRVINHSNHNLTIHWHGVKQIGTCWYDGPAYITQCPIQPEKNFTHKFTVRGQRGTLLWHAHISWLRATIHGAIVIFPKRGIPYPFPKPYKEKIIILGEWWKADVEAVVNEGTRSGLPPNISDAHTINGHSGPVPGCSSNGKYTLHVKPDRTYLLRIINAAINDELFFKISQHNFTIVEVDASYTKPFQTDTIFISPGQTTNALLTPNEPLNFNYLITASPFKDTPIPVNNSTSKATLIYNSTPSNPKITLPTPIPPKNSTFLTNNFLNSLRSLNSKKYPTKVPLDITYSLFFTLGVGLNPCTTCRNGTRFVADFNNVTFVMPRVGLLEAHYYKIGGVFSEDFPGKPVFGFNYTGNPPRNIQTANGTKVYRVVYNATVQVVFQGTAVMAPESHPVHLHGFNFYVVGKGMGNFDPIQDPNKFNLVDPVERNTVGVPTSGWTAVRFRADNPGIWFLHCHLEVHTTWGLKMAFLVDNGEGPNQSLPPPPGDLPKC